MIEVSCGTWVSGGPVLVSVEEQQGQQRPWVPATLPSLLLAALSHAPRVHWLSLLYSFFSW